MDTQENDKKVLIYFYYLAITRQKEASDTSLYQISTGARLITTIPWGHNQHIIFKCKDMREAVFYAQYTLENSWSRDVLKHQIESGLYERKRKAITNFKDKLPANASDLAIQTLKDPYSFDFLTTRSFFCKKH